MVLFAANGMQRNPHNTLDVVVSYHMVKNINSWQYFGHQYNGRINGILFISALCNEREFEAGNRFSLQ